MLESCLLAAGAFQPNAVITDGFASDAAWAHARGDWSARAGRLVQTQTEGECRTLLRDAHPTNHYVLEVDARKVAGNDGFVVLLRYQGKNVHWYIGGWGNVASGVELVYATRTDFRVEPDRVYHLKAVVQRSIIEGWVDGERLFRADTAEDQVEGRPEGPIGLGTCRAHVEFSNFRLTVYPDLPPPAPKSLSEVLADERPRDWLYEEVVAIGALAHQVYGRLRPRLPAPAVQAPPKLDGQLDDPAWAAATSWRIWIPWQRHWPERSWERDPPLAPLTLLCCRHGGDLYVGARWNPEQGPPLKVGLDRRTGVFGRGGAEWCLKGQDSAAFQLTGCPLGDIEEFHWKIEVAPAPLAVRFEGKPDYAEPDLRLVLRAVERVPDARLILARGSQPQSFALEPGQTRPYAFDPQAKEGLTAVETELVVGKSVFALPTVRYVEPLDATLHECDVILGRNPAAPEELRRGLGELFPDQVGSESVPLPHDPALLAAYEAQRWRERHVGWREEYRKARALKSKCLLAEAANLPPIALFTGYPWERPFGLGTYMCWDIVRRWGCDIRVFDPRNPDQPARQLFADPKGVLFDMNVSYDARTLFFSFKRREKDSYHLYEIGAGGSGPKQVTAGPFHDVHPLLLPDGQLLFVSTRVQSYSMCQPGAASAMFVMNRDGSDIRSISANTLGDHSPQMMPDGRVMFTRWEYVDRGLYWRQGLWTIAPDGTRVQLYFGNTIGDPNIIWQARPIPGRPAVIATFGPHHGNPYGALGIVTNRNGLEARRGLGYDWITREFPHVGDRNYYWAYRDPFPVSSHTFLVSYGGSDAGSFRIFLLDDRDNRECIYSDPAISCFNPLALRPHTPPPVIAPLRRDDSVSWGTFVLLDVYRGLPNVLPGDVRYIQIMEQVRKPCNMRGQRAWDMDPLIGRGTYYVKRCWGIIPVEDDGSAHFRAPANREIYFQALDADGKEIQRMTSFTQLMPGETQSCIGCHEARQEAPPNSPVMALRRPPSEPAPHEWGNGGIIDFVKLVQPVLDRHCVKCHGGPDPKKGLDLSDDKTRYFNMAYSNLTDRRLVQFFWLNAAAHDTLAPHSSGAQVSPLLKYLDADHCGAKIPLADHQRVYVWIDANVPYYGTYENERPGTSGSRDLWAGEWYRKDFAPVYQRCCGGCHDKCLAYREHPVDGSKPSPADAWINLTHPEWSRVLLAPLAKSAGGLGLCSASPKGARPIFSSRSDPDYVAMLKAITAGHDALMAKPRIDMSGARPVPYPRDFGRVFAGFAGP